jgi:hypothetical protein
MAKKKAAKKKMATNAEGRGELAKVARSVAEAHGKEWTGSQFLSHVKEKFADSIKNPDGSILQAWVMAKKKLGLGKTRGKKKTVVAKKGKPGRKPLGNEVGNGMVSVAALRFIQHAGSIQAAKIQLESLEELFGEKVPF